MPNKITLQTQAQDIDWGWVITPGGEGSAFTITHRTLPDQPTQHEGRILLAGYEMPAFIEQCQRAFDEAEARRREARAAVGVVE